MKEHPGAQHEPPTNPLQVTLDGEITSPFEWMGAGRFRPDPRSGAMHGGEPPLRELFYGSDGSQIFVRLDGAGNARVGLEFESGPAAPKIARGRVIELEAPRAGNRFRVTLSRDGLAPAVIPPEGWFELE